VVHREILLQTKEKLKESLKTIDGLKAELKAAAEATKQ
jgi:hypothetical protein